MHQDNSLRQLMILKSMAFNYPILKEHGLELSKPLFLIVDNGQAKTADNILSAPETPRLNAYMNKRDVTDIMEDTNSDFVIFPYSRSRKAVEFLELITAMVCSGGIGNSFLNAMPIVIAEDDICTCDMERFFTISVHGNLSGISIEDTEIVPPDETLPIVFELISSHVKGELSSDKKAFMSATCFLYPSLKHSGVESSFKSLLEYSKAIVADNDNSHDTNNLGDFFIRELYHWQENTGFCNMYELPNLEMSQTDKIDDAIFFDRKHIFMGEALFKKATAELLETVPADALKKSLVREGILCPENKTTYTVKMGYYNIAGTFQRKRMLRFYRDKFERIGEPSFVELCGDGRGD